MQNRYAASRRERSMSMLPEECRPFPDPTAADGLRKLADRELHAAIRAAVDTLPPATRQAFVLYYLRGDSGREAAAQLGISEPAFFMRLKSGRDAVRKQLITKGWQV
jgi:RNA polymerase sigma factor (sigma-70 family)